MTSKEAIAKNTMRDKFILFFISLVGFFLVENIKLPTSDVLADTRTPFDARPTKVLWMESLIYFSRYFLPCSAGIREV